MAYEFLKKLFGEAKEGEEAPKLTYEELEAEIDADAGLTLVNIKDGGYVAKSKFDAKETELKGVKEQLTAANEQIKSFEGQDVEGIKQKVSEWEQKYNTDTAALKEQMQAQERSHAEDMFMSEYKFTSKAARNGVLAELRAKNFQIDNGTILGGKEFMQSLMENEDFKGAFVTQKQGGEGGDAGSGSQGGDDAGGEGGNDDANGQGAGGQDNSGTFYNGQGYQGQNAPRFTTAPSNGQQAELPKGFNFGFNRVRQPKDK